MGEAGKRQQGQQDEPATIAGHGTAGTTALLLFRGFVVYAYAQVVVFSLGTRNGLIAIAGVYVRSDFIRFDVFVGLLDGIHIVADILAALFNALVAITDQRFFTGSARISVCVFATDPAVVGAGVGRFQLADIARSAVFVVTAGSARAAAGAEVLVGVTVQTFGALSEFSAILGRAHVGTIVTEEAFFSASAIGITRLRDRIQASVRAAIGATFLAKTAR